MNLNEWEVHLKECKSEINLKECKSEIALNECKSEIALNVNLNERDRLTPTNSIHIRAALTFGSLLI